VSASSFTVSTPAGEKVTVKESSLTVYEKGTTRSVASAVTKGKTVLVLGKVNSSTITASQVIMGPAINLSKASANVTAFKTPNQSESKSVGQIPASYKQGTGTIISGTKATKATKAALTSYAGGVVDRVVRLSNGEYEVHYIGVNWPHHLWVGCAHPGMWRTLRRHRRCAHRLAQICDYRTTQSVRPVSEDLRSHVSLPQESAPIRARGRLVRHTGTRTGSRRRGSRRRGSSGGCPACDRRPSDPPAPHPKHESTGHPVAACLSTAWRCEQDPRSGRGL
jgi:hypothetical protein